MASDERQISAVLRALVDVVAWREVASVNVQETVERAQKAMWDNISKQNIAKKSAVNISLLKPKTLKQSGSLNHSFSQNFRTQRFFTRKKGFRPVQQPAANEFKYKLAPIMPYDVSSSDDSSDESCKGQFSALAMHRSFSVLPQTKYTVLEKMLSATASSSSFSLRAYDKANGNLYRDNEEYRNNPNVKFQGGSKPYSSEHSPPFPMEDDSETIVRSRLINLKDDAREAHHSEKLQLENWERLLTTRSYQSRRDLPPTSAAFEKRNSPLLKQKPHRCEICQIVLSMRMETHLTAEVFQQSLYCDRCRFVGNAKARIAEQQSRLACNLLIGNASANPPKPRKNSKLAKKRFLANIDLSPAKPLPPLDSPTQKYIPLSSSVTITNNCDIFSRTNTSSSDSTVDNNVETNAGNDGDAAQKVAGRKKTTKGTSLGVSVRGRASKRSCRKKKTGSKKKTSEKLANGRDLRQALKKEKKEHKNERELCKKLRLSKKSNVVSIVKENINSKIKEQRKRRYQNERNKKHHLRGPPSEEDIEKAIKKRLLALATAQLETVVWENGITKRRAAANMYGNGRKQRGAKVDGGRKLNQNFIHKRSKK
jgi:hypothetical protein